MLHYKPFLFRQRRNANEFNGAGSILITWESTTCVYTVWGYDVVDLEPGRAGRRISRDPVLPHLTKVHLFITTHKRTIIMSIKKK
ncbi:hypothetical protein M0657_006780 [Pyricularia oryzae]|nr:hypothetical protein M0657_006780 [Pyricularia oryzae]KAI7927721.1 hypothetical protein M9X92_002089 [Pyricularia oryzae]